MSGFVSLRLIVVDSRDVTAAASVPPPIGPGGRAAASSRLGVDGLVVQPGLPGPYRNPHFLSILRYRRRLGKLEILGFR